MKKIALVLEGGALRGVYTSGVLDVLLEENIIADCVIGVSAGALNGMNYITKQKGRSAKINLEYHNDPRYIGAKAIKSNKGLIGFDYLFGEISHNLVPFDFDKFNNSEQRFIAVATNCITGKSEFFENGKVSDMFPCVQASASMPLASDMVFINDIPYLDGAVSTSIPIDWAINNKFDKIIVVLTRDKSYEKPEIANSLKKVYATKYKKYPKLIKKIYTMPRRYNRLKNKIEKLKNEGTIFVIRPQKPVEVSRLEKDTKKLENLYKDGINDTRNLLNDLKSYLNS
mgnify:FL=1